MKTSDIIHLFFFSCLKNTELVICDLDHYPREINCVCVCLTHQEIKSKESNEAQYVSVIDINKCHGEKEKGWKLPEETEGRYNLVCDGQGGHTEKGTFQ